VRTKHSDAGLRDDVREAIELALPDDRIEFSFDPGDSYFWDVRPKLRTAFQRLKGGSLEQERDPFGELDDEFDDRTRSYDLFFLAPHGAAFRYATEIQSPDDGLVNGRGTTGLAVAVSLLAPFAVVTVSDMGAFDDGSRLEPSIEPESVRNKKGEPAYTELMNLRDQLGAILEKHWISVLPEEEWRKPVPWLEADEEILVDGQIRVLDALFFEMI
jgi:hypothetical protein